MSAMALPSPGEDTRARAEPHRDADGDADDGDDDAFEQDRAAQLALGRANRGKQTELPHAFVDRDGKCVVDERDASDHDDDSEDDHEIEEGLPYRAVVADAHVAQEIHMGFDVSVAEELGGTLADLLDGGDAGDVEEDLDVAGSGVIEGEGGRSHAGHGTPGGGLYEADHGEGARLHADELLVELAVVIGGIEISHRRVEGRAILDGVALGLELGIIVIDGEGGAAHAALFAGSEYGATASDVERDAIAQC